MTDSVVHVPRRTVPILGEYDIIVCGAGPAGIGAAVAAGRSGARTLLVERMNSIGGIATATGINTWCDTQGGPIFDELEARIGEMGKANRRFDPKSHTYKKGRVTLHGETVKAVALRMIRHAGVDILFGTIVTEAWMDGRRVRGVCLANKGGLSMATAKVVIDATADADVAASAGADFLKGDPEDGRLMHVNFMFSIGGANKDSYERDKPPAEALLKLIHEAHQNGEIHPPAGAFRPHAENFPYHLPEQRLLLNYWEIEKVDCSDPIAVSRTIEECQIAALEVAEFCRRRLPGYERCEITRFWDALGTRESRRIVGRYMLTKDDVLAGRKFDDGIALACFFIDFHDSPPGRTIPYDIEFKKKNTPPEDDWYEIPYRCLLPKETAGLLVAGRCISADRSALASLRVMPTCMYTGEAAGTGAALAVARGIDPHDVDGEEVRKRVIPG